MTPASKHRIMMLSGMLGQMVSKLYDATANTKTDFDTMKQKGEAIILGTAQAIDDFYKEKQD